MTKDLDLTDPFPLHIDPMDLVRDRAGKAYAWATASQLPPHDRLDDAAIPEIVRRHFEEDVPALMQEIAWLRSELASALADLIPSEVTE